MITWTWILEYGIADITHVKWNLRGIVLVNLLTGPEVQDPDQFNFQLYVPDPDSNRPDPKHCFID